MVGYRRLIVFSTVMLLMVRSTHQSIGDNEVDEDDGANPFMDIASTLLQNTLNSNSEEGGAGGGGAGLGALGGLIGGLMNSNNGNGLGDMLLRMQNGNNGQAGDIISSLGSLLTNKDGNLDPNILGSVINAFADSASKSAKPKRKTDDEEQPSPFGGLDLNTIMNIASAFTEQGQQKSRGDQGNKQGGGGLDLASALPMLLNAFNAFNGQEAEERAHKHAGHAAFLPPIVEKFHVFWDHFINSELGSALWENLGLSAMTKSFTDKDGNVDFEVVLKSLENHSFRRRWIKTATNYLTEWVIHLSNPEVQQRYLTSGQFMLNGFLKSQGFPKHALFQPTKFAESVTSISNYVLLKYMNINQDVSIYVKPAVKYMRDLLKTAQHHGSNLRNVDKNIISDKLTDTLNLEIIEPVLRVYRAYRFAIREPKCQTHVLCVINRHDPNEKLGLPGFKVGLTRFSSFVASAALSYQSGHGFWDLYNAIQDNSNCMAKYPAFCDEFHEQEISVTTEYYHNEL